MCLTMKARLSMFFLILCWTGHSQECEKCLENALDKLAGYSLKDCTMFYENQSEARVLTQFMQKLINIHCKSILVENSQFSYLNLFFTLIIGVFCLHQFGLAYFLNFNGQEIADVNKVTDDGCDTYAVLASVETNSDCDCPALVKTVSDKPSEESEDDACCLKQQSQEIDVKFLKSVSEDNIVEDQHKAKETEEKEQEQGSEVLELSAESSRTKVEDKEQDEIKNEGFCCVDQLDLDDLKETVVCNNKLSINHESNQKEKSGKDEHPSIGEPTPPLSPSIGHEEPGSSPPEDASVMDDEASSLDHSGEEFIFGDEQEKINETKPMVFVGGISASTSPMELVNALKAQGYKVMVVPRIRYGVSFGFCPDLVLSSDSEVQTLLAKGRIWVKDRWVDIRPYIPKDVPVVLPAPIAAPDSIFVETTPQFLPFTPNQPFPMHPFFHPVPQYQQGFQPFFPGLDAPIHGRMPNFSPPAMAPTSMEINSSNHCTIGFQGNLEVPLQQNCQVFQM